MLSDDSSTKQLQECLGAIDIKTRILWFVQLNQLKHHKLRQLYQTVAIQFKEN